jgi:hypothetical protein
VPRPTARFPHFGGADSPKHTYKQDCAARPFVGLFAVKIAESLPYPQQGDPASDTWPPGCKTRPTQNPSHHEIVACVCANFRSALQTQLLKILLHFIAPLGSVKLIGSSPV